MRRKKLYGQLVYEFPHQLFSPGSQDENFREWIDRLRSGKPVVLEIGMGTGDFLISQATQDPARFFLGIEMKPDRIYKAYAKADQLGLKNIAFLQAEASRLPEFRFPPLEKIYLLFSDPWPKKRHAARRLTSERYLPLYEDLLVPKGELMLKTDDRPLFDYSITSLRSRHWKILAVEERFITPYHEQTAYERRFLSQQKGIYYLKAESPERGD